MPFAEVYCPRCDRIFTSMLSREAALKTLSNHMDLAHTDMLNYIKEEED